MLELAATSVTLNTPVNKVFAFVTNMENYVEWFPGVIKIEQSDQLPHASLGKRYTEIIHLADQPARLNLEVIEVQIDRCFVTQGDLQPLLPQMTMTFDQIEQQCKFQVAYHSRQLDGVIGEARLRMIKADIQNRAQQAMKNLRQHFSAQML